MADIIINEKFRTLIPPLNKAFGYMERVSH